MNDKIKGLFFAQYLGQKVYKYDYEMPELHILGTENLHFGPYSKCVLLLRTVDQLTDEEKIQLMLLQLNCDGVTTKGFRHFGHKGHSRILTEEQVYVILSAKDRGYRKRLAKEFGVSEFLIKNVRSGKSYKAEYQTYHERRKQAYHPPR